MNLFKQLIKMSNRAQSMASHWSLFMRWPVKRLASSKEHSQTLPKSKVENKVIANCLKLIIRNILMFSSVYELVKLYFMLFKLRALT